jgi:3-oxoacyl-[acyl-carrier-protein] synthase III
METDLDLLRRHLVERLKELRKRLGYKPANDACASFAELLDSMGMVEYVAMLAQDLGTTPEQIEACAGHPFSDVGELAKAIHQAGMRVKRKGAPATRAVSEQSAAHRPAGWLAATSYCLPRKVQLAEELDDRLQKPRGWLHRHAGILRRHVWQPDEAFDACRSAVTECAELAGAKIRDIEAVLVTSEAPALPVGQAAAVHHRLGLTPNVFAVEVGGACTGFLAAMHLAQALLSRAALVLIVALEAPSRYLPLEPGAAGEAAALFGDVAAAGLLSVNRLGKASTPIGPVLLWNSGEDGGLIRVAHGSTSGATIQMQGIALAAKAIRVMAASAQEAVKKQGGSMADVAAIVAHGGNGRMPEMLARVLGIPGERVWSETAQTGNLGSASLPVAWSARGPIVDEPVVWTTAGAGLTWGAMMSGTFAGA